MPILINSTNHDFALRLFLQAGYLGLFPAIRSEIKGSEFPKIGLGAGIDKKGNKLEALFELGFQAVEIGPVVNKN